jgi:hypothetical protein
MEHVGTKLIIFIMRLYMEIIIQVIIIFTALNAKL